MNAPGDGDCSDEEEGGSPSSMGGSPEGAASPSGRGRSSAAAGTCPKEKEALTGAPDPDIDDFRPLLSIDATSKGNVARFINHSCDGNLTLQVSSLRGRSEADPRGASRSVGTNHLCK